MKRSVKLALSLGLGMAAAPYAQAASPGECIQAGPGVSRVVATVRDPVDCCTVRMQCAQFLSTTTAVKPSRQPNRT